MSAQETLSRRDALSLLGVTTGSVVLAASTTQAAEARADGLTGVAASARAPSTSLATGR